MVPIIIELTRGMGLDPRIYVVALAMASNIGGTATLIGDPPNIIIGSKVGLTFNQFALNLFLPVGFSPRALWPISGQPTGRVLNPSMMI